MAGYSSFPDRSTKPLVPAWVLSIGIHAALIVALCMAIKPYPHGAADAQYGSMGIVLHRISNSNTGAMGEADRPIVQQTAAIMEVVAPPLLLASAEVEASQPAATKQEQPAETPKPASG